MYQMQIIFFPIIVWVLFFLAIYICSHLRKKYHGIEPHQWQKRLSKCHLISILMPSVPFSRAEIFALLCHFSLLFYHLNRHIYFRMLKVDIRSTKSKEIDPVVEEQEEQQFSDGTDGPSKSTAPAVSPAIDLRNG